MLFSRLLLLATVVAEAASFDIYFQSGSRLQQMASSSNWQPISTAPHHTLSRKVTLSHPRARNYVQNAVRTRHRIRYIDTPNEIVREIDPRTPSTIAIASRSIPVVLYFKTSSSRMNVQPMSDHEKLSGIVPVQHKLSSIPKPKKESTRVKITAAVKPTIRTAVFTTKQPKTMTFEATTTKPLSKHEKHKTTYKSPTAIPLRTPVSMASQLNSDEDFDQFNMLMDATIPLEPDSGVDTEDLFEDFRKYNETLANL